MCAFTKYNDDSQGELISVQSEKGEIVESNTIRTVMHLGLCLKNLIQCIGFPDNEFDLYMLLDSPNPPPPTDECGIGARTSKVLKSKNSHCLPW